MNRSLIEDDDKYQTKNLIAQKTIIGFQNTLINILTPLTPLTILEAGCGTGYISECITNLFDVSKTKITAFDLDEKKVQIAQNRVQNIDFFSASIYDIPFPDDSFDLVISTEVLEHLDAPEKALSEVLRVSKKHILVSVPDEPIWRITKMLRGKYLRDFGNTPGHIKHWSKRSFKAFLNSQCDVREIKTPFPWLMALCAKVDLNE